MKLRLLTMMVTILSAPILANPLVDAVAITATSSALATGSAVYMRNKGMNPAIVDTNVGPVAVPGPQQTNQNYNVQNGYQQQQSAVQQKRNFMGYD